MRIMLHPLSISLSLLNIPCWHTCFCETTQAGLMQKAFAAQRAFIAMAAESKKPSPDKMPALLDATSKAIGEITAFKDAGRRSDHFNHLSAVAEGIPALGTCNLWR